MNLKAQRAAALAAAQGIVDAAKAAARALTADEQEQVKHHLAEVDRLDLAIQEAAKGDELVQKLAGLAGAQGAGPQGGDEDEAPAKSLGEHFVKSVGIDRLARLKTESNLTLGAEEWTPQGAKASTDTHTTPSVFSPLLTTVDRTIVGPPRRPVVSDVLGTGNIGSATAVTYFVENPTVEGNFSTVAESGQKPQFHIGAPTTRTDALRKIAGILSFTDEMIEDLEFWVSEINQRGLYMLALAEENQLLNGDGSGNNLLGLRNRSGVQVVTSTGATDDADALFRAATAVQTASGLTADAILINPADYQALRLAKDGNDQYYGGGYFQGQYGQGGIEWQPPLWGLRTIPTAAAPVGEALVGAFSQATTVYRKGGVRVESTNSHSTDFDYNRVRTRIEERIALAVRVPAAIAKVTLSSAPEEEG